MIFAYLSWFDSVYQCFLLPFLIYSENYMIIILNILGASQIAWYKEHVCQCRRCRRVCLVPDCEIQLESEMANCSSTLSWKIPWTEGPGWLQSVGPQNSWTQLNNSAAAAAAKSLQSCPTLCDPIDGSPPGFPAPMHKYMNKLKN